MHGQQNIKKNYLPGPIYSSYLLTMDGQFTMYYLYSQIYGLWFAKQYFPSY